MHSAFESTLNSSIVSYRLYGNLFKPSSRNLIRAVVMFRIILSTSHQTWTSHRLPFSVVEGTEID